VNVGLLSLMNGGSKPMFAVQFRNDTGSGDF
jgi:hypothetical protein